MLAISLANQNLVLWSRENAGEQSNFESGIKKSPQKSGSASFPRAVKLGNEAGQSQRALNVRANCEDPSASLPESEGNLV